MPRRPLLTFSSALLLAGGLALSGCADGAAPAGSPSASVPSFASDEEAYAAAEAAYDAYADALNLRYEGREGPDPAEFLVGAALDSWRSAQGAPAGTTVRGRFVTTGYERVSYDGKTVEFLVCQDISNLRIRDADGNDVTPPERQNTVATRMQAISTPSGWKISSDEAFARC